MIPILLDTRPTEHDQANSRIVQMYYGMKQRMLELIEISDLKDEPAIIVIELPLQRSFGYYFIGVSETVEDQFIELFRDRLDIDRLAEAILNGTFKS